MGKLLVRDLMTPAVVAVRPEDDAGTLCDLMAERRVRHMPVVDENEEVVGLVSHRDLLRNSLIEQADVPAFVARAVLEKVKVADVMTGDVETVGPDVDIREAAQAMFENKYGCLPVVEGRHLVGILTEADFVRFLAEGH